VVKYVEFMKPAFILCRLLNRSRKPPTKTMMKNILKISLFIAAIVAAPALSRAQDTTTNAPAVAPDQAAPAPAKLKKQGFVFRGTVSAIDTNTMTLTVETRTFDITSDTKIMKDGQPATLGDGVVGEPVSGAYKKGGDGKLNATSVRFGAKKKKEAAAPAN
jgi:hypothetical protein